MASHETFCACAVAVTLFQYASLVASWMAFLYRLSCSIAVATALLLSTVASASAVVLALVCAVAVALASAVAIALSSALKSLTWLLMSLWSGSVEVVHTRLTRPLIISVAMSAIAVRMGR